MSSDSHDLDVDLEALDADAAPGVDLGDAPHAGAVIADRLRRPPSFRFADGHSSVAPALYRRRRLAACIFFAVFGAAAIWSVTMTPVYEAHARILIDAPGQRAVRARATQGGIEALREELRENRVGRAGARLGQAFLNRDLASKTLDTLGLWNTPPFAGPAAARADRGTSNATPAARAIRRMLASLRVSQVPGSRLVDVRFRASDAALAAKVANGAAESYIALTIESRIAQSKEAGDWLDRRIEELRQQADQAQSALQRYREQHNVVAVGRSSAVVRRLIALNEKVTDARTARIQKEVVYQQLSAARDDPSLLAASRAVFADPFLLREKAALDGLEQQEIQLADSLGDRHPRMQGLRAAIEVSRSRLRTEIAKLVDVARHEYEAAVANEQSLTAAFESQKNQSMALDRTSIQYDLLKAEVDSNARVRESLVRSAQQIRFADALSTSGIRVIDPAEPPLAPVRPVHSRNLAAGMLAAILLTLGVVLGLEYMDATIRTPGEATEHTGFPTLALLPAVVHVENGPYPLLSHGTPAGFDEACRQLRSDLMFSMAARTGPMILVTSTGPGEGKSMVAANAAVALAQSGQRVLLIDADLRRPVVHTIFPCPQEPGLSNILTSQATLQDGLCESGVPGLSVLTAGRIPPNPPELLGSKRFEELLASLSADVDWVIVDSPPVMAVTDASLMTKHASGVLFVVAARTARRGNVRRALEQLVNVRAPLLGVVLNRVELDRGAGPYGREDRQQDARYHQAATPPDARSGEAARTTTPAVGSL